MKIEEFVNTHQGRINLSIVPNGFSKSTTGKMNCCFSMIIGLNIEPTFSYDYFDIDSAYELIEGLGAVINLSVKDFELKIEKSNNVYSFKNALPFNSKHIRRWRRLLYQNSFYIRNQEKDYPDHSRSYTTRIKENINQKKGLFDAALLEEVEQKNSMYTTMNRALNEVGFENSVEMRILTSEKNFDSVLYQGHSDALDYYNSKEKYKSSPLRKKDLLILINSIYQHPTMARYYGLIYDFEIANNSNFIADYLHGSEKVIYLDVTGKNSYFFQNHNCLGITAKNVIKVYTAVTINGKSKYYHGLENFGFLKNDSFKYSFLTVSPDQKIQNDKLINDSISKIYKENNRMPEFSDLKRKHSQGIFLIQKTLLDLNALNDCKVGTLGQNIVTLIDSGNSKELFSLCKRNATYDPIGLGNKINVIEEGWLHTNLSISGVGESFSPQTIFHWTGHNLCVPKIGSPKSTDQKLTPDEKKQSGGIVGIFENEEDEILKNSGYEVKYSLVDGADTFLITEKKYKFIIRQVLSNGYTTPIESDYELSLEDLVNNNKTEYFFGIQNPALPSDPGPVIFSLDEEPINPPTLVSKDNFEEVIPKTTESDTHIVVFNRNEKNTRLIFPPIIDFQFAQYLGMVSKEELKANNKHEYLSRAKRIAERAKNKIPKAVSSKSVTYLPDTRGTHIVLTPANWFTRAFLIKQGQNLELSQSNDYFDYTEIENNFKNLTAGSIELYATTSFKWSLKGNKIQFNIIDGIQLKFYIQIQHENLKSNRLFDTAKQFKVKNKGKILFSNNNQPQYAKGEFQVTCAKAKPDKPVVKNVSVVSRPTKATDLNKIFFTFEIANAFPYLQTVKQLQLVTESIILNDDEKTIPDSNSIDQGMKKWADLNQVTNFKLLNYELPKEVFERNVKQIETEIYKNNFGFKFNLQNSLLWNSLKKGDVLINFNVGTNFNFKIIYNDKQGYADFYLNDKVLKSDQDLLFASSVIFKYQMQDALFLEIVNQDATSLYRDEDCKFIPYQDLSEKNLSLIQKAEQILLTIEDPNSDTFEFLHANEFFVFRTETKSSLIRKTIAIQAVSRFQEFYPNIDTSGQTSVKSDKMELLINNNVKPALPIFQITPLLFHDSAFKANEVQRKRSMQLMFEIEKPLQKEETFALILSENDAVSPFTCGIGRDLTTFNSRDFYDPGAPEGLTIDNFILDGNEPAYLNKYWNNDPAGSTISSKIIQIRVNNTPFKILPLYPYYEQKKNKWIVVIALDQDKLRGNNLNAYNPFLKIVAIKYTSNSTKEGNFSSEFTTPKYINVLTERYISVKHVYKKMNYWNVEILNDQQIKQDNQNGKRTIFIVCLREQSYYGITGTIVKSTDSDGISALFHIVKNNQVDILTQKNKLLCVYEFETFDNTIVKIDSVDWFQDQKVRLMYAEDFN